jgi:hypothetical protein
MNQNKIKKISVKFPNFVSKDSVEYEGKRIVLKLPEIQDVNNRMYSELFSGNTYQVENVNETIGGLR